MRIPAPSRPYAAMIVLMSTVGAVLAIDAAAASAAPPDTNGGTRVPSVGILRRCDFTRVNYESPSSNGSASAVIRATGSTVVAEVELYNSLQPNTHYDVGLIQQPRLASSPCGPGDPGTAYVGLDTDATGRGTATVQAPIQSGATGAWVFIRRPAGRSQSPVDFYTSEFVAPV